MVIINTKKVNELVCWWDTVKNKENTVITYSSITLKLGWSSKQWGEALSNYYTGFYKPNTMEFEYFEKVHQIMLEVDNKLDILVYQKKINAVKQAEDKKLYFPPFYTKQKEKDTTKALERLKDLETKKNNGPINLETSND